MIDVGDLVVATRKGGRGPKGPLIVPLPGQLYRLTSIYPMKYGLGCTLDRLNPVPYKGFILYAIEDNHLGAEPGWYFKPFDAAPPAIETFETIEAHHPITIDA